MEKLRIMCIDDQREVLSTLRKDLDMFNDFCIFIECETADEAEEVLEDIDKSGMYLALVISDQVMPGKNGVDFFIDLNKDTRFPQVKKLLLTGLATHEDTIKAINEAHIDHYIEKPWSLKNFQHTVRILLTEYICDSGLEYEDYIEIIDQETLYRELRES